MHYLSDYERQRLNELDQSRAYLRVVGENAINETIRRLEALKLPILSLKTSLQAERHMVLSLEIDAVPSNDSNPDNLYNMLTHLGVWENALKYHHDNKADIIKPDDKEFDVALGRVAADADASFQPDNAAP